jgi:hypothetical protein
MPVSLQDERFEAYPIGQDSTCDKCQCELSMDEMTIGVDSSQCDDDDMTALLGLIDDPETYDLDELNFCYACGQEIMAGLEAQQ